MSEFSPTIQITAPPNEPDLHGGAVADALGRSLHRELSAAPIRIILMTLPTVGFWPIAFLNWGLHGFILQQQQQFAQLAERLGQTSPDVSDVKSAAERIKFIKALSTISIACAIAGVFILLRSSNGIFEFFRSAYSLPRSSAAVIFTAFMSAASLTHWIHLAWHQSNVDRFLRRFNAFAEEAKIDPVEIPAMELGLGLAWIICGIIFAAIGGLWGLPLLLAAGAHRRYIMNSNRETRATLGSRLRTVLARSSPTHSTSQTFMPPCMNANCRAILPPSANFCPRCGKTVV